MPVFTPGPTKSGFLPKKRLDICSRGNAIGGTTLETMTSCTSFIESPAKSKSALSCRPYSSPVRSFSVCTRKESRNSALPGRRSNTPSTVLVLPTSMARSTDSVSGSFQRCVNVPRAHICSQHRAMFHICRHHTHQLPLLATYEQGAVLGQVHGLPLQGRGA